MAKNKLATGVLGTFESVIMGIAGTAPAYSLGATAAAIVAAVGVLSVGSLFYCGLVMFGLMYAFIHLNKMDANAGATYAWAGKIFGKTWGFFSGWSLVVASLIFMVSATIPAATSTLALIAPSLVDSTTWVAVVAGLWLTLVTAVVTRGIRHASVAQVTFSILEIIIVVALIIGAFYQYWGKPLHAPSFSWLSPFAFTWETFTKGALGAIFFYWGWDVTLNLSEETKAGRPHPASKGAFWSMVNLILIYIILMIVILIVLSDEEIQAGGANVLLAVGNKLFPEPWGYIAVIATMLSTVGTIETTMLQYTRSMFAMARDNLFHKRYAAVHPKWETPYFANLSIWAIGLVLIFASSFMPSVSSILEASITAIGFQICFYLSMAGLACAWYYRNKFKDGIWDGMTHIVFPGLAALYMVFVGLYTAYDTQFAEPDPENPAILVWGINLVVFVGIGAILLGFIPLLWAKLVRNKK
ncbi:MAG: APC family permease [Hydrotalea sp.]|nr:APC family permease [Hydrotalea sp.]